MHKGCGCLSAGQPRPLHFSKTLRHPFIIIGRVIDDDGYQKGQVGVHEVAAIDRKFPLETEVALTPIVCGARDDREK